MKNLFIAFAAIPLLFACNPENNPSEEKNNPKELIVTAEASDIEYTSVTLAGYANLSEGMTGVTFGIIISQDENLTVDNGKLIRANELDKNNKFYCKISNLLIGTKYYYKAYLKEGDYYRTGSKTLSFTTKDFADDLIVTTGTTEIDFFSAVLNGSANIPSGLTGGSFGFILSENEDPTVDNGNVIQCKELDGSNKFSCKATSLSMVTTYYYKAYFKYNNEYRFGKTLSFTTKDYAYGTPLAVDLGLSVKWASFNVGASKPEEYGFYYAWGETKPMDDYSWDTYKWGKELTKYCTDSSYGYNGFTDGKTVLDPEDDVAHVKLGGKWRMPTDAEWTELRNNCTWKGTMINGVIGRQVTGPNGNSIFLPAAGSRSGTGLFYKGSHGYFWSSSLITANPNFASSAAFYSGTVGRGSSARYIGNSVRPVSE